MSPKSTSNVKLPILNLSPWRMAASCLSHMVTAKADGRIPESFEVCMNDNGFAFCPDCRVFGNQGEKCMDGDHMHSWCWVKDDHERD